MARGINEDTARTIQRSRESLGAVLKAAQKKGQKAFIVFLVGFLGAIISLQWFVWDQLKFITRRQLKPRVNEELEIVATTPFDVILLQVKIGLVVGIFLALPVLLYYSKEPLRERGLVPRSPIDKRVVAAVVVFCVLLFLGGLAYGYFVFFPFMFSFLAENAIDSGVVPTYSIVDWTQFIVLLSVSFGLAAELPLAMSALTYADIVSYETFRDKWRHAIIAIFVFGAFFSPPDPFTQVMWAVPLTVLYGFSLYLSSLITTFKQGQAHFSIRGKLRSRWWLLVLAGTIGGAIAGGVVYFIGDPTVQASIEGIINWDLGQTPIGSLRGIERIIAVVGIGLSVGILMTVLAAMAVVYRAANRIAGLSDSPIPAAPDRPGDIDLGSLDAAGVESAPPEVFASMAEDEAVEAASLAMEADEPAKAQAILDRFDAATEGESDADGSTEGDTEASTDEGGNVVGDTATGIVNAFTEDETTEEDIGGYYWDIAFIFESLTSKMFRIVGTFMIVMAAVFIYLYNGGLGRIKNGFLQNLPPGVRPDQVNVVALHPVEALIFDIKVSVIFGGVVTIPVILYYAWPALEERGIVPGGGYRIVFLIWGLAQILAFTLGGYLGFTYVAPTIISFLVTDAIEEGMIIAYRLKNFFWLIFLTTAGIGFLMNIPVSMVLFQRGGVASFALFRDRWREVVVGVFLLTGLLLPGGVLMMLLLSIPVIFAYVLGLGVLWLLTLGGRLEKPRSGPASVEDTAND